MNKDFEWVSSLSFEEVPSPVSFCHVPRLSINSRGVMTMNRPLQSVLDCSRPVHMEISRDGRVAKLYASESGALKFSQKGQLKHSQFLTMLQQKGIQLPCCYTMEWWPEQEVWIGFSEDLPEPPLMEPPARSRRRKAS